MIDVMNEHIRDLRFVLHVLGPFPASRRSD